MKEAREIILRNWHDLADFGIIVLTGEADATGLRLLCDLTANGVTLMEAYLGTTILRGNAWNASNPLAASITLARSQFLDLTAFCILQKYPVAWINDDPADPYVIGFNSEAFLEHHEMIDTSPIHRGRWVFRGSGEGLALRNRHNFTGRLT